MRMSRLFMNVAAAVIALSSLAQAPAAHAVPQQSDTTSTTTVLAGGSTTRGNWGWE